MCVCVCVCVCVCLRVGVCACMTLTLSVWHCVYAWHCAHDIGIVCMTCVHDIVCDIAHAHRHCVCMHDTCAWRCVWHCACMTLCASHCRTLYAWHCMYASCVRDTVCVCRTLCKSLKRADITVPNAQYPICHYHPTISKHSVGNLPLLSQVYYP